MALAPSELFFFGGQEVYAYGSVLETAQVGVGDPVQSLKMPL